VRVSIEERILWTGILSFKFIIDVVALSCSLRHIYISLSTMVDYR
jgi:hypothetical protein